MLFFGLELPDAIVYKTSEAFVDFNFTFLFIHVVASFHKCKFWGNKGHFFLLNVGNGHHS